MILFFLQIIVKLLHFTFEKKKKIIEGLRWVLIVFIKFENRTDFLFFLTYLDGLIILVSIDELPKSVNQCSIQYFVFSSNR